MKSGTIITPAPAYQKPSGKLYLSSPQLNLANGVWTLVTLTGIGAGFTDGIEDTANFRITPGYAGFYIIQGLVTFLNVVAARNYSAGLLISNTTWLCANTGWTGGGVYYSVPVLALVKLSATDYVELKALSGSGDNTVDLYADLANTYLSVQRVR